MGEEYCMHVLYAVEATNSLNLAVVLFKSAQLSLHLLTVGQILFGINNCGVENCDVKMC